MYYRVSNVLEQIDSIENLSDSEDILIVLTLEEWKETCKQNAIYTYYIDFENISFSKSEVYKDLIAGTFLIPKKGEECYILPPF